MPYDLRFKAKSIAGNEFDRPTKQWLYPLVYEKFQTILDKFPDVVVDNNVEDALKESMDNVIVLRNLKKNLIDNPKECHNYYPRGLFTSAQGRLFGHQKFSLGFFSAMEEGFSCDFSEPGTGKTLVQIGLIKSRIEQGLINKILIFCPNSITETVWQKEINYWFPEINCFIINSTELSFLEDLFDVNTPIVYIVNYEKSWRIEEYLKSLDVDMIICDESTRIKTYSAKQSKAIHHLGRNVKYKSIMTGTPVPNSYLDIYSQLKFIDPSMFGTFSQFRYEYFTPSGYEGYTWIPKEGTSEKIKDLMYLRGVCHRKRECLDLPGLTVQDLYCELKGDNLVVYKHMLKEMIAYLNSETYMAAMAITKVLRLIQITSGFIQNTDGVGFQNFKLQPKFDLLMELLMDIPKDCKVVIWAIFRRDIEFLRDALGDKAVTLYGGTPLRKSVRGTKSTKMTRAEIVDEFQNDGKIRYFIAHPASAGHGINLSIANYAIYYSMSYNFEHYEQSKDRIERIGQEKPMTVYRLMVRKSVDRIIYGALGRKKGMNEFLKDLRG